MYLSSNYHHDSAKYEKSVNLGTPTKQYVMVKIKGRSKVRLPWRLGSSPKPIMADFCCDCQQ